MIFSEVLVPWPASLTMTNFHFTSMQVLSVTSTSPDPAPTQASLLLKVRVLITSQLIAEPILVRLLLRID